MRNDVLLTCLCNCCFIAPSERRRKQDNYCFGVWHDYGNVKHKHEDRYFGALRHIHPQCCVWNSYGQYTLLRYGRHGISDLPDVLNGNADWGSVTPLITNDSGTKSYYYNSARHPEPEDCDFGVEGTMYKDIKNMKAATGTSWSEKTTHIRRCGFRYAQAHGCDISEVTLLAGLSSEKGRGGGSGTTKGGGQDTARKYYATNLSYTALMACAGTHIRVQAYCCARGWCVDVTNIDDIEKDADMVIVLKYLFPNLLDLYRTVHDAYHRPKEVTVGPRYPLVTKENANSIPGSKSNVGCLKSWTATVGAWVQDSMPMLTMYPDLKTQEPYSWLFEDTNVSQAFERIGNKVMAHMKGSIEQGDKIFAERREIMNAVTSSNLATRRAMAEVFEEGNNRIIEHVGDQHQRFNQQLLQLQINESNAFLKVSNGLCIPHGIQNSNLY